MDSGCNHEFLYTGVVFEVREKFPGSDAISRKYFNHYYCKYCLVNEFRSIKYEDPINEPIQFNATPKESRQEV